MLYNDEAFQSLCQSDFMKLNNKSQQGFKRLLTNHDLIKIQQQSKLMSRLLHKSRNQVYGTFKLFASEDQMIKYQWHVIEMFRSFAKDFGTDETGGFNSTFENLN